MAEANFTLSGNHPLRGHTALIATAINQHYACMQMLLFAKADVNAQLPDGQTALLIVATKHHVDIMKLLIAAEVLEHATVGSFLLPMLIVGKSGRASTGRWYSTDCIRAHFPYRCG